MQLCRTGPNHSKIINKNVEKKDEALCSIVRLIVRRAAMKTIAHRKTRKKGPAKVSSQTALTTKEDEMKARKQRGQKEKMQVEALEHYPAPFDTYKVCSEVGIPYTVEIRSFVENVNSCSCPDFLVNTLCTCKHIEGVLHQLQSKTQRSLALKSSTKKSPQVEIYLKGAEMN